jgi:hypothetical protein
VDPDLEDALWSSDDSTDEDEEEAEDLQHLFILAQMLFDILDDDEYEMLLLAELAKLEHMQKRPPKKRRRLHCSRPASSMNIMEYLDEDIVGEDAFWQAFHMKRSTFHKLMDVVSKAKAFRQEDEQFDHLTPVAQMLVFLVWLVKGDNAANLAQTYGIQVSTVLRIQRRCIAAISEFISPRWSFSVMEELHLKARFAVLGKRTTGMESHTLKKQSIRGVCMFVYNFCVEAGDHDDNE